MNQNAPRTTGLQVALILCAIVALILAVTAYRLYRENLELRQKLESGTTQRLGPQVLSAGAGVSLSIPANVPAPESLPLFCSRCRSAPSAVHDCPPSNRSHASGLSPRAI